MLLNSIKEGQQIARLYLTASDPPDSKFLEYLYQAWHQGGAVEIILSGGGRLVISLAGGRAGLAAYPWLASTRVFPSAPGSRPGAPIFYSRLFHKPLDRSREICYI